MDSDYKSYISKKTKEELIDILGSIDKEKYPDRYKLIIERMEELGENVTIPRIYSEGNEDNKDETKIKEPINRQYAEYASVWIRFAAILIDGLILIPFYLPIYIIGPMLENDSEPGPAIILIFFILIIASIIFGIWNTIVRMGKTGQSLGRKFLNIAVLNADGSSIGVGKALLREWIGRAISGLICYLGYLNAFWDKDKQMWHDKIASCYVYYVEDNFS